MTRDGSPSAVAVLPLDEQSDAELHRGVVARRLEALEELYRRHGRACYRMARRVAVDAALAEDCVQEAYLGLWREPQRYVVGQGALSSWLVAVTHHKAVDLVRREAAQQRRRDAVTAWAAIDPQAVDPEDEVWASVRAQRVRRALGDLPEAQREVVALAYFGGYTQREIAELTGTPLGTVKTRTLTALRKMKDVLATAVTDEEERA